MSRLGDRSGIPGLDQASGWKMIQGSPGPEIDVVFGIELGCSYELGSGLTRIRVLTRPRKRLGMVMTVLGFLPCHLNGFPCIPLVVEVVGRCLIPASALNTHPSLSILLHP